MLATYPKRSWAPFQLVRENGFEDKIPYMPINEIFHRPVEGLPISVRTAYGLRDADIKYVGDLVQCTEEELLEIKNFGRKSLNEVKTILADMGLSLGMRLDN
jgi:DNA-directed RNA polymerase subunit alpha